MELPPIKSHLELRDWLALGSMMAVLVGGLIDIRQRIAIVETKVESVREAQQAAASELQWFRRHTTKE